MPQLDTSAWFITIMSMFMMLFIMFQLKISKHSHPGNLGPKSSVTLKQPNSWEKKWMKMYSPLSLPQ